MFRNIIGANKFTSRSGFRYRGRDSSRLQNLTDTVFGFSMTLLVISLQVPATYVELQASMYSFIGFVFCAMLLLTIWKDHYTFFLKYGLEDDFITRLNFLFLFILLFYVYPLKYLFNFMGTFLWLYFNRTIGNYSDAFRLKAEQLKTSELSAEQWQDLMIRFGLGLFAIYLIFFFFHYHAYKKRRELNLNALEIRETRVKLKSYFITLAIPLLSIAVVLVWGGNNAWISGACYLLYPVLGRLYKQKFGRYDLY